MAHPDNPNWTTVIANQLEDRYCSTLVEFLHSINRLAIKQEYLLGNIMVIGQAQDFPERTLLCTDKFHGKLRANISLLACCDPELSTNPKGHLDANVEVSLTGEQLKSEPHGSIVYYHYGAKYAIDHFQIPSNFFHAILAFHLVDLAKQLHDGLFPAITRVLRPRGYFMGSGGMRVEPDYYEIVSNDPANQMELLQHVRLPNPSYSGYPFDDHIGVILQKM